jgi:serine/threonine protein kinase
MAISPGDSVEGLRGTYRVEARHGEGSFGVAYRGADSAGSPVILKELRLERLHDWKALELFEREAQVLATLSHPNIPAFRDFFAHGEGAALPVSALGAAGASGPTSIVLVQQFIDGTTLQQHLDRARVFGPDEAGAILRALLGALRHLHEREPPLVHRDVKPGNVVLTPAGQPYLVDFGAIQDRLHRADSVGSTVVGTLGYMPLEQLRGQAVPASDLYALGMTMVVMLAGLPPERLPIDDSTGKVMLGRVIPARTPRELRDTLDAMIEVVAGRRVRSAAEALTRLETAVRAAEQPARAEEREEAHEEAREDPAPPSDSPRGHRKMCPTCGKINRPDAHRCRRCSHDFELHARHRHAVSSPSGQPAPTPPPPSPPTPPQGRSLLRRLLGYEALCIAGALAVPIVLVIHANPDCGAVFAPAWDRNGGPPVLVSTAGGDVIVARLRNLGGDDQLLVGAFDGATARARWKAGPFGAFSANRSASTHFVVGREHVLVTDAQAKAHIYDLATGRELHTLSLTDRVGDAASVWPVPPDGAGIRPVDGRTVVVDLAKGTVTPAPDARPPPTPTPPASPGVESLPAMAGYVPTCAFESGGTIVGCYHKSPGTPTPVLAGIDAATSAVRWKMPMDPDSATARTASDRGEAVVGDRFVGVYSAGKWHVTAVEVEKGTRQWDVALRPISSDYEPLLLLSASRVYLARDFSIEVLDAATGKTVGLLGTNEDYK